MGAHLSVPMYRRTLPQRLGLEGGRCTACGAVAFPPRPRCRVCGHRGLMDPLTLAGRGNIHALTEIARVGAPPEFAAYADAVGGYHVAIVELEEGPRMTGQIIPADREPVIGDEVTAVTRGLYIEEGVRRYGFKFELVEESGDA